MEGVGFLLFVVVGFGLVLVVACYGYRQAKKRRETMAAYAASRGWRYDAEQPALVGRFHGSPFGKGHSRRAFNAVYGTHDGRDFVAFDYEYKETSGTGKDRRTTTYDYSVMALSVGTVMPALEVSPEGFFTRAIGRLTGKDIELELEDFNRAFTVTCPDRKFASDVLHPQMMEYLLAHPDVAWRLERDSLLVVSQTPSSTSQIDWILQFMDGICDWIPEFVWRELEGRS